MRSYVKMNVLNYSMHIWHTLSCGCTVSLNHPLANSSIHYSRMGPKGWNTGKLDPIY